MRPKTFPNLNKRLNKRSNKPINRRQQGFTLLELLIASIIFAVMAVMAYGGLSNVMNASETSKTALLRLKQIQQTISILNRDFSQIVERSIRDEYGTSLPFLTTEHDLDNLVEFTRGGRKSPPVLLRSSLVRVAYRFDEDKLVRLYWPQLDRSPNMEPKKTALIDNVEKVSIRFMDTNKEWQEHWPPLSSSSSPAPTGSGGLDLDLDLEGWDQGSGVAAPPTIDKPLAIEIVLQLKDWGDIRRLYAFN